MLYVPPGVFVGHDALDKFAGDLRSDTSSLRLYASWRATSPAQRGDFGMAQARKARPLTTPDWMSSLFAMARSLRSTSFSIPNLLSGPRHPCGLPSRLNEVPSFRRGALLPRQFRQEGPLGGLITIPRRQDIVFKPRGITVGQCPDRVNRVGRAISACRLHPRLRTCWCEAAKRRFGPSAEVRALIRHHPGDPGPMKFPWYCGLPVEDKYRVVRTLIVLGHFVS